MNLAETQAALKRGIIIVALLTFTFYTGRFLIVQSINLYRSINPRDLPPPEASFGVLPQLKMSRVQISGTPQYVLDTENGNLPQFPDRLKVYPLIKNQANLLSEQKIKQLATDMQFTSAAQKLSNSVFRWVDGANSRTFQADAVTKNYRLDTPPFRISNIIASTTSITEEDATSGVEGFLKSKALLSQTDLENLTYETIPTQVNLGQIRESKAVTTPAKVLKVDVFFEIPGTSVTGLSSTTKYRVLGPNPRDSLISFTTTNSNNIAYKYPIINFIYWEPDYPSGSDYYLTPVNEVWQSVQNGAGIISYVRTRSGDYYVPLENIAIDRIDIRRVYLAYFMQPDYSDTAITNSDYLGYLQPIYVFEGQITTSAATGSDKGDIFIYFPAVRGDFVSQ